MWCSESDIDHWITIASPGASSRHYDDLVHRAAMKSASRVAALVFDVASHAQYEPGSIALASTELEPEPRVFLDPGLQFLLAEAHAEDAAAESRQDCALRILERARSISKQEHASQVAEFPWLDWATAQ